MSDIDQAHPDDRESVEKQLRRTMEAEPSAACYALKVIEKSGDVIEVEVWGASILLKRESAATGIILDTFRNHRRHNHYFFA